MLIKIDIKSGFVEKDMMHPMKWGDHVETIAWDNRQLDSLVVSH